MIPTLLSIFWFGLSSFAGSYSFAETNPIYRCPQNVKNPNSQPNNLEEEQEKIRRPEPVVPIGCQRPFLYRGVLLSSDHPQAQDGAGLRSVMLDVPEALELMDQYQANRKRSKVSAYTGTAGIAMFVLANFVSTRFEPNSRDSIRSAMTIGGLSLAAGGFLYSFALLRTNELLIPRAVERYNAARPNDPIQIQFSTSWGF